MWTGEGETKLGSPKKSAFVALAGNLERYIVRFAHFFGQPMDTADDAWLQTANGERLQLRGTCTIGREPGNTMVLTTEKVSRRHALIHAQNETEFWLVDLGSRN